MSRAFIMNKYISSAHCNFDLLSEILWRCQPSNLGNTAPSIPVTPIYMGPSFAERLCPAVTLEHSRNVVASFRALKAYSFIRSLATGGAFFHDTQAVCSLTIRECNSLRLCMIVSQDSLGGYVEAQ